MVRDDFDVKFDHYNEVRNQLGLTSVWSNYDVENLSDRHPFEGATQICYHESDHSGDKSVVKSITGSTWAALFVAADACIRDSGDEHHIYIEQLIPSSVSPNVLFLYTGS